MLTRRLADIWDTHYMIIIYCVYIVHNLFAYLMLWHYYHNGCLSDSNFETYSTAQCSTERECSSSEVNHKHEKMHTKVSPDLYASYIQPSLDKANRYQKSGHSVENEEDNDTNDEGIMLTVYSLAQLLFSPAF